MGEIQYEIKSKDYFKFGTNDIEKLKSVYQNNPVIFKEIIDFQDFKIKLIDFTLLSLESNHIGRRPTLTGKITLDIWKDFHLVEKEREFKFKVEEVEKVVTKKEFQINFIFLDIDNVASVLNPELYNPSIDSKEFECFIIYLCDALCTYINITPSPRNLKHKNKKIWNYLFDELKSPELLLMIYGNFNQQIIQNNFRDFSGSDKKNDEKNKTTAEGLEKSLSSIVLPNKENILSVNLDDSFRISFK